MSYSRSRRQSTCSSCYGRGHTKRWCPILKDRAAAAASKPENERTWGEIDAIEKVERYNNVTRVCSYCSESAHNSRSCTTRKQDILDLTLKLVEWRKRFFENISISGCGIGAVIRHKNYSYNGGYPPADGYHYAIITGYCIESLSRVNDTYGMENTLTVMSLNRFGNGSSDTVSGPIELGSRMNPSFVSNSYHDYPEVVSGSFGAGFDYSSHVNFAVCEKIVLDYFGQRHSRNKVVARRDYLYQFGNKVL